MSFLLCGKLWNPRANKNSLSKNTVIFGIYYSKIRHRQITISAYSSPLVNQIPFIRGGSQTGLWNVASIKFWNLNQPVSFDWTSNLKSTPAHFYCSAIPNAAMVIRCWYNHGTQTHTLLLLFPTTPGAPQTCTGSLGVLQTQSHPFSCIMDCKGRIALFGNSFHCSS